MAISRQSGPRRKTTTCRKLEPGVQRPAIAMRLNRGRRSFQLEAARLADFAEHVNKSLRPLHQHQRYLHARNVGVVPRVDLLLRFGKRQALHEHAGDAGQLNVAGRRDRDLNLQTAERARAAVDRVEQVFEPRVDGNRRHGDRRRFEVFLERLFKLVAQCGDRAASCPHLAQQRQRDRAIRLNDQLARDIVVGRFGFRHARRRRRARGRR